MPAMPVLARLRQKACHEFKTSPGYRVRPYLKKTKQKKNKGREEGLGRESHCQGLCDIIIKEGITGATGTLPLGPAWRE